MNEFENILRVYMSGVDILLNMKGDICSWSKDNTYANFRVPAFKTIVSQQGRGENYRYYLSFFRLMGWIICQDEKFSNVQRIEGKPVRVVTVDHERYVLLKKLIGNNTYNQFLKKFIDITNTLIGTTNKTKKEICMFSCGEAILNVKSSDYRIIMKKYCTSIEEYRNCMEIFRDMSWIISQPGNYTNVQWIKGKSVRVISIDYEKYKTIKALVEETL